MDRKFATTLTAKEKAKAKYHLRTGGKGGSQRKNLFQLTCDVGAYDPVPYWMNPFRPHYVPKPKIVLGAVGNLGSDGKLWKALADDREFDVTPYIAGENFYFFAPGQQKYQLVIGASSATTGAWLDPDVVVPGAQFCVGQSVSFGAGFQPTLSEAPEIDPLRWGFGGTYVNDHTNAGPNCSENYFVNSAKLSNPSQNNWWVGWTDGDTVKQYNAIIAEGLTFANGQYVVVDARGKFSMFRPQVSWVGTITGSVGVDTNYSSGTWLHFGNPATSPGITLVLSAHLDDWNLGKYSEVQLIDSYSGQHCQTNWQSIHESASGVDGPLPSTNLAPGLSIYYDSPGILCRSSDFKVSETEFFETFLMFKPNSSGSISVPLKLIGWNWSGIANADSSHSWTLISQSTPPPTPNNQDTITFPTWTNVVGPWPQGYTFITNATCQ